MRVIQVVNVRWYNACAWYGLELARLLKDAGHEPLVVALPGTEPEARAREAGLEVAALEMNHAAPHRSARTLFLLARLIRSFGPQVVDCHRGESFVLLALLRRILGSFALVRTRGDQRPPRNDPVNRALYGRAADAVVATNSAMARHLTHTMRLPEDKVFIIRGGVDTSRFAFDRAGRERVRAEFGFAATDVVAGLVGRFDTVKGQRELIEALALARRRHPELKLLLIGFSSAVAEETVREWIADHGVQDAVRITGRRDDLPALVSALDVGVCASLWSETIARAPMEIMACRVPLVASRVGVLPDLVHDDALFDPGEVERMASLLGRAASEPAWLETVVAAQRATMHNYTSEAFLRATMALYHGLPSSGTETPPV